MRTLAASIVALTIFVSTQAATVDAPSETAEPTLQAAAGNPVYLVSY